MNRLTRTAEDFDYCLDFCGDCKYPAEIHEKCLDAMLYERLRAYEDTGLEPEEIKDYLPMLKEWRQNMGALRYVHELIKSEAEGRLVGWIPVTDRLPDAEPGDVSERVLVTDGKDVAIAEWFNFEECGSFWGYTGFGKDVTHWMPLPEPPEEPRDEQEPRFQ